MENLINWFEIPASNFKRAVAFYEAILDIEIEETDMYGDVMGFFPSDGANVSGAIIQGESSSEGVLVYLNGGNDLQKILDKIEPNHGKVVLPKTQISPEVGYFALFMDSEGNKMALHSKN